MNLLPLEVKQEESLKPADLFLLTTFFVLLLVLLRRDSTFVVLHLTTS